MDIKRRKILALSAAFGAAAAHPELLFASVKPTPAQSLGPFYPLELPLDSDNDLVQVAGQQNSAKGEISNVIGQVLDDRGRPVRGAQIEIWQCDANGRYRHPGDRGDNPKDPGFQGYGRFVTEDQGAYRFRTIKPVSYPGRAPHIHFAIRGPGFEPLVTQMYVRGAPQNRWDGILNAIRDKQARESLIVAFEPDTAVADKTLLARFDIVLGTLQKLGKV